ncbi:hypothetical protein FACS1894187_18660 [Synergistales bacterium]|nr:hypothetical protein FACS1894187_18660 [Synergistales bacterium]
MKTDAERIADYFKYCNDSPEIVAYRQFVVKYGDIPSISEAIKNFELRIEDFILKMFVLHPNLPSPREATNEERDEVKAEFFEFFNDAKQKLDVVHEARRAHIKGEIEKKRVLKLADSCLKT